MKRRYFHHAQANDCQFPANVCMFTMCQDGIQLHPESNNITRLQSTATAKKHVDACWNCFIQGDLVLFQRRFCCSGDPDSVSWSEWGEKARPLHAWICNPYFSRNDWLIINYKPPSTPFRKTKLWWNRLPVSQWSSWGLASCDLFCEPLSRGVGTCISTASQASCGSAKVRHSTKTKIGLASKGNW